MKRQTSGFVLALKVHLITNDRTSMAARTRMNATTTKLLFKKDGNILSTMTVVAADEKTLTITTTGKDAKGQSIDSVAVYDKQ